jgi:hypothetical protein
VQGIFKEMSMSSPLLCKSGAPVSPAEERTAAEITAGRLGACDPFVERSEAWPDVRLGIT